MKQLMDADKYCEFLNNYPIEKAQKNFMTFYRDALQHTFECEVEAIPIEWIKTWLDGSIKSGLSTDVCTMLHDWGVFHNFREVVGVGRK